MKDIEKYKRISLVSQNECPNGKHCDDCDECITDDNLRYFCKLNYVKEKTYDEK